MLNKISVGDARELSKRIDGDIALVICDPVYWEYWQYSFVAELGLSLLVPGGSVIAQAGDEHRLAAENALQIDGMINCPLIMEHMSGGFRQLWNTRSLAVIKPWLRIKKKGKSGWMPNYIRGFGRNKNDHVWGDTHAVVYEAIKRLSKEGDIVLDPFTGSGVVPAICKRMGRQFIAFEIDEGIAEIAQNKIDDVELDLFWQNQEMFSDDRP